MMQIRTIFVNNSYDKSKKGDKQKFEKISFVLFFFIWKLYKKYYKLPDYFQKFSQS